MQSTAGLPQAQSVRLAFGLRNFGAQYAHTRHNAGEWWVARVAARNQASFAFSDRQRAEQAVVAGVRIARNCTYMNESGFSVGAVAGFYKIPAAAVLIAHDELDLPCGSARLKFGGGLAGHNGLRDVKRVFASGDYWRLRIGIGRPQAGHDAAAYVLGKPPADEMELIEHAIERAASVWPQIVAGDMDAVMRILHGEES